ncbi:MAG TPA: hypothetical protein VEI58_01055 [Chthoniobacterales bacterium]|nr:hypothetical protein [Chthoniobacterales bacterium]
MRELCIAAKWRAYQPMLALGPAPDTVGDMVVPLELVSPGTAAAGCSVVAPVSLEAQEQTSNAAPNKGQSLMTKSRVTAKM